MQLYKSIFVLQNYQIKSRNHYNENMDKTLHSQHIWTSNIKIKSKDINQKSYLFLSVSFVSAIHLKQAGTE